MLLTRSRISQCRGSLQGCTARAVHDQIARSLSFACNPMRSEQLAVTAHCARLVPKASLALAKEDSNTFCFAPSPSLVHSSSKQRHPKVPELRQSTWTLRNANRLYKHRHRYTQTFLATRRPCLQHAFLVLCASILSQKPKQLSWAATHIHTVSHSESSPSEIPPLQPNRNSSDMFCQLFIRFCRVKRTAAVMQVRKGLLANDFGCVHPEHYAARGIFAYSIPYTLS